MHSLSPSEDDYQYLRLVAEVSSRIQREYVDVVKPDRKFPEAFASMLKSLDNCSSYLNKKKTVAYELFKSSSYCNTGIYGAVRRGYFRITSVRKDSSAWNAGIRAGDIVKAIGGESIFALSFWEVYLSLISEKPEEIELVIFRKKSKKPEKVLVKSEPSSEKPSVSYPSEGICHISLKKIDTKAVEKISEILKQEKKIILDLRNYEGGNPESAGRIAELFNTKSKLTIRYKKKTETVKLSPSGKPNLPYVIIIADESTIMEGQLLIHLINNKDTRVIGRKSREFCRYLKKISFIDDTSIVMTHGIYQINGKDLSGKSIKPDIKAKDRDFIAKAIEVFKEYNGPEKKENK